MFAIRQALLFLLLLLVLFSCNKKKVSKSESTTRKYTYHDPYNYTKPQKESVSLDTIQKNEIKKDSINQINSHSTLEGEKDEEEQEQIQTKAVSEKKASKRNKKFHWLSLIAAIGTLVVMGLFVAALIYLTLPSVTVPFLTTISSQILLPTLFGLATVSLSFYAFSDYLNEMDSLWGAGFSIGALYASLVSYFVFISLNYANLIFAILGSYAFAIFLGAILIGGFTYYFYRLIKKLKKEKN